MLSPNPALRAHTTACGDFVFAMIDSADPTLKNNIPEVYRDLLPDGWLQSPLVGKQVVSLCFCGKLGLHCTKRAFDQAKSDALSKHTRSVTASSAPLNEGTAVIGREKVKTVTSKSKQTVNHGKQTVTTEEVGEEEEIATDGTIRKRKGVKRRVEEDEKGETTNETVHVTEERVRELEMRVEVLKDAADDARLEARWQYEEAGSLRDRNDCQDYQVTRIMDIQRRALEELVDREELEKWYEKEREIVKQKEWIPTPMGEEMEEGKRERVWNDKLHHKCVNQEEESIPETVYESGLTTEELVKMGVLQPGVDGFCA